MKWRISLCSNNISLYQFPSTSDDPSDEILLFSVDDTTDTFAVCDYYEFASFFVNTTVLQSPSDPTDCSTGGSPFYPSTASSSSAPTPPEPPGPIESPVLVWLIVISSILGAIVLALLLYCTAIFLNARMKAIKKAVTKEEEPAALRYRRNPARRRRELLT